MSVLWRSVLGMFPILLMVAKKKKLGDFAHVLKTNGTLENNTAVGSRKVNEVSIKLLIMVMPTRVA